MQESGVLRCEWSAVEGEGRGEGGEGCWLGRGHFAGGVVVEVGVNLMGGVAMVKEVWRDWWVRIGRFMVG